MSGSKTKTQPSIAGEYAGPAQAAPRVLIVDDEPFLVEVLQEWLIGSGYVVVACEDSLSALRALNEQAFSLLVSDVMMPGIQGPELARKARVAQPRIALLFISGFAGNHLDPISSQQVPFLEKPFRREAFLGAVKDALSRQQGAAGGEDLRPRALILDDELIACEFMSDVAESAGYHTRSLTDATELSEGLAFNPSLILLDLNIPGMDGIEMLRVFAERRIDARVVLVSGEDRAVLNAASKLGVDQGLNIVGTLRKPLRAADLLALFRAAGRPAANPAKSNPPIFVEELRRALEGDEFLLYYQPQVALADGAWVGIEALIRWQHPQHGLLFPGSFVELAERSGLGLPMTLWVIKRATAECEMLNRSIGFTGTLSINLPPVAMIDRNLPEQIMSALAQSTCPNNRKQFEVTETSVAPDPVAALDILTRLRLKGIALSIDDFGTGHSSLAQLRELPFGELKIDMSFVRNAEIDTTARAIVEHSIQLSHQLGLKVLAEGVETEWTWRWLAAAGCELAQGYFIGRPMPAALLSDWQKLWIAPKGLSS